MVNLNARTLTYSFLPCAMHSAGSILYGSAMELTQPHLLNIVLLLLFKLVIYSDQKCEEPLKLNVLEVHCHVVSVISFHSEVSQCMLGH